jgi:hypothetical protein
MSKNWGRHTEDPVEATCRNKFTSNTSLEQEFKGIERERERERERGVPGYYS